VIYSVVAPDKSSPEPNQICILETFARIYVVGKPHDEEVYP